MTKRNNPTDSGAASQEECVGAQRRRNAKGRERSRQQHFSRTAPSQRNRGIDPSRKAAFDTIRTVNSQDAYGNLVLSERIRAAKLGKRDAALATELAYGTLRWQGTYDEIISLCLDKPLGAIDAAIVDMLRLGSHQLLNTRIAPHAAVDQSVSMSRAMIGAGPAQLVNAVLRRISARSLQEWFTYVEKTKSITDETLRLGIELAHPPWIIRALRQALTAHGNHESELDALLSADNRSPAVNLAVLDGIGDPAELFAAGAKASPMTPKGLTYSGGDVGRFEQVRTGKIRVQDIGSQLVTRALAAVPTSSTADGSAQRWADLCAGPGGKTALLAALAQKKGYTIHATEIKPHRAELVKQALKVFPEKSWEVHAGDGRKIGERYPSGFDKILLDAPCSGLGALRRRPEARWRKLPGDIPELAKLQSQLAGSAYKALKPGGILGFVVCSPHIAETIVPINDILKAHCDATLINAQQVLKFVMGLTDVLPHPRRREDLLPRNAAERTLHIREKTVQLWPHIHGTDAMFLALIHKDNQKKGKKSDNKEGPHPSQYPLGRLYRPQN